MADLDFGKALLLVEMLEDNDAGAATVGEYLVRLAEEVWLWEEAFSGKRPFGNSGWEYEVYEALARAGHLKGDTDQGDYDKDAGDRLVNLAFAALYKAVLG